MTPFDVQYKEAIRQILDEGIDIPNPWSGRVTRMVPGVTLRVDVGESFPLLTLRKIPLKLFIAEQVWYLMGENNQHGSSNSPRFGMIFSKMMER